jgi:hypothetical protein
VATCTLGYEQKPVSIGTAFQHKVLNTRNVNTDRVWANIGKRGTQHQTFSIESCCLWFRGTACETEAMYNNSNMPAQGWGHEDGFGFPQGSRGGSPQLLHLLLFQPAVAIVAELSPLKQHGAVATAFCCVLPGMLWRLRVLRLLLTASEAVAGSGMIDNSCLQQQPFGGRVLWDGQPVRLPQNINSLQRCLGKCLLI